MAKGKKILPSIVLIIMTLWWLIPFFIRDLTHYPITKFGPSYNYYWTIFVVTSLMSVLIFIFESLKGKWKELTFWGKYFYGVGTYFLNSLIIFFIAMWLRSEGLIDYFGGDPEGSVGMLFFPMAIIYFLAGAFIYFGIKIINRFKKTI